MHQTHEKAWAWHRIQRHAAMLFPLAWPSVLSRLGVVILTAVDTIMVGQYSSTELAYLNLGASSLIMLFVVIAMGLLLGVTTFGSQAIGRGDPHEAGRVLRRTLPYATVIGTIAAVACMPAETFFLLTGQSPDLAAGGGAVMRVMGFGLLPQIIAFCIIFWLEGIERPRVGMYAMMFINLINVLLNYGLIFGAFGLPELGAVGSAWSTTITRWIVLGILLVYILRAPSLAPFAIWTNTKTPWAHWAKQRQLGFAIAVSLGAEVLAFVALTLFAGILGEREVAAFGISFNLLTIPFMLATGLGVATAVRVGVSHGRGDQMDTALAGWTGLGVASIALTIVGIAIYFMQEPITHIYTSDPALVILTLPLMVLAGVVLVFDGQQVVMANALRGLGESWPPMFIQTFSYIVVMLPLSYLLTFTLGHGTVGLWEATIIASIVSAGLQGLWFFHKTRMRNA